MPWPVYTERILYTATPMVWVSTTVPAGRRAIIKSVVALSSATTGSVKVHCVAANIYFGAFVLPDQYVSRSLDILAVAYAGDEIRVYIEGQSGSVLVSGWVLEDPGGRQGSDFEAATRPELPPPGAAELG